MKVNLAPMAMAATISAPCIIPVSMVTSRSLPTSRTTSGSSQNGTGARSSWRPPWLDRIMPSTPRSASFLESSTFCTPLTTSLPGHMERISSKSENWMLGSIAEFSSSPTVPPVLLNDANDSVGVVRKSTHHQGRGIAFATVPNEICGGMEKPLRLSRSRAPAIGVSTVKNNVSKPAAAARFTSP